MRCRTVIPTCRQPFFVAGGSKAGPIVPAFPLSVTVPYAPFPPARFTPRVLVRLFQDTFEKRRREMRISKQLSVTLVNKPGRLANVLSDLTKEKVSCVALSVMNAGDRGTLRIVPDNLDAAIEILEKQNIHFEVADVLLAPISAQNGAIAKVCERLAAEHLNIDYVYCALGSQGRGKGAGVVVIKVNDLVKAQRVLAETANPVRRKLPTRRPVHIR
jgi:hypothetical protein